MSKISVEDLVNDARYYYNRCRAIEAHLTALERRPEAEPEEPAAPAEERCGVGNTHDYRISLTDAPAEDAPGEVSRSLQIAEETVAEKDAEIARLREEVERLTDTVRRHQDNQLAMSRALTDRDAEIARLREDVERLRADADPGLVIEQAAVIADLRARLAEANEVAERMTGVHAKLADAERNQEVWKAQAEFESEHKERYREERYRARAWRDAVEKEWDAAEAKIKLLLRVRTGGAARILAERLRQVDEEGWTPEHDALHTDGSLAQAAAAYAACSRALWPWDEEWWKPKDRERDLERAGALIAAELDRLAALPPSPEVE